MKRFAVLAAAALLSLGALPVVVRGQSNCVCTRVVDVGSCRSSTTVEDGYPGDFPGSLAVVTVTPVQPDPPPVPPLEPTYQLWAADLFGGFSYRYDPRDIRQGPLQTVLSPGGSAPTTGVVYEPVRNVLYWMIDGEIFRTEVPDENATGFAMVDPIDADPDVDGNLARQVAELLLGDAELAGTLGGLTHHRGRDTFWTLDITHDIYFEVLLDGSLSLGDDGLPVHFFSPHRSEDGTGAFGNSLTYVNTPDGEFLDILIGPAWQNRASEVLRVNAPTDPANAGLAIGSDSGIAYPIGRNVLRSADVAGSFPMGIVYQPASCGEGQGTIYLSFFDQVGQDASIIEVSSDDPQYANVADLTATSAGPAVSLTWRGTPGYDTLTITRSSLTDSSAEAQDVEVGVIDVANGGDPESFSDFIQSVTPDGAYRYTVEAAGMGIGGMERSTVVTVGRGTMGGSIALPTPTDPNAPTPQPGGVTATADTLIVVDQRTGTAQTIALASGELGEEIASPFSSVGRTHGVAHHPERDRLFWLGSVDGLPLIQSTLVDGTSPNNAGVVVLPSGFLRAPQLSGLAYDPRSDAFWVTDTQNDVIFSIQETGALVQGSLIADPADGDGLGGGIDVVASTNTNVTLDYTVTDDADSDDAIFVERRRFERADTTMAESMHRIYLPGQTNSSTPGGIVSAVVDGAMRQYIVSRDQNRVTFIGLETMVFDGTPFQRGDANDDGRLNISDPSFILTVLFRGTGTEPACQDAADANDSGAIDLSDAVLLFNYLFRAGAAPADPVGVCGFDSTDSALTCESSQCAPMAPEPPPAP